MFKSGIAGRQNLVKQITSKYKMPPQNYDSFLVIDFEATCQEGIRILNPEIIEFPCLKVSGRNFNITEKFHSYVKPIVSPQLSTFCTKLTGITQEMVDTSENFSTVFGNFQSWLMEKVGPQERFLFVTCGDWDLKSMLPNQCERENIVVPPYFQTYMNIKKTFAHQTGIFTKGMMPMLKDLNIKHEGRQHSGIDDCNNIANILKALNDMGCVFRPTEGKYRRGPPAPPPLAEYAEAGASKLDSEEADRALSKLEYQEKSSMYPSLSGYDFPSSKNSSSLYEPYENTDGDRNMHDDNVTEARCMPDACAADARCMVNSYAAAVGKCVSNKKNEDLVTLNDYLDKGEKCSKYSDKIGKKYSDASIKHSDKGAASIKHSDKGDASIKHSDKGNLKCPDFPTIVLKLKENLFSKNFKSRDQEELHALCAAGKYLHTMEAEDKCLVEARLRYFYVTLVHGRKVAENDAKSLLAVDVGIHVDPQLIHRHHHGEKRSRKQKHIHSNCSDQFEVI